VITLGYIDESYEGISIPETFTLSCSLASGADWPFIETAWAWVIGEKNESLAAEGRKLLRRYHAVDCFNRINDFDGWEKEERNAFVQKLFRVFEMFPTSHIALTVSARDIAEIWPENKEQPLHFAYNTLLRLLMLEIARNRYTLGLKGNVSLMYERSDYGVAMTNGFTRMMEDPTFLSKDMFTTLAPMGWEKCLPLQIADLAAYEVFHDVKRRDKNKPMNLSLEALVQNGTFQLISKRIMRVNLVDLRARHDKAIARGAAI
jgi:hypothetical protein